jgi:endonuclease/exonuclease/phosphatase family metal-dependent hydrolase
VLLRVMTWNIHRAIGVDRRFRPDRVVEVISSHDPDIALLQEVDDGVPRSARLNLGIEIAHALDYPHYAIGHNVALRAGRYGNATLSRWPIVRERNIDLTVGTRKPRGCQQATIRIEKPNGHKREIEVFNLHLGLSARERERQVGMLARSQELSSLPATKASLIGGDFNDWRNLLSPIFTEILEFRCATERRSGRPGSLRSFPSFSPTGGLDRVYYRGPLHRLAAHVCRLRLSRVASDHRPVLVDFELR